MLPSGTQNAAKWYQLNKTQRLSVSSSALTTIPSCVDGPDNGKYEFVSHDKHNGSYVDSCRMNVSVDGRLCCWISSDPGRTAVWNFLTMEAGGALLTFINSTHTCVYYFMLKRYCGQILPADGIQHYCVYLLVGTSMTWPNNTSMHHQPHMCTPAPVLYDYIIDNSRTGYDTNLTELQ